VTLVDKREKDWQVSICVRFLMSVSLFRSISICSLYELLVPDQRIWFWLRSGALATAPGVWHSQCGMPAPVLV
jgi:hypothetical protein